MSIHLQEFHEGIRFQKDGCCILVGVCGNRSPLKISIQIKLHTVVCIIQQSERCDGAFSEAQYLIKVFFGSKAQRFRPDFLLKRFDLNGKMFPHGQQVIVLFLFIAQEQIFCSRFRFWKIQRIRILNRIERLMFVGSVCRCMILQELVNR